MPDSEPGSAELKSRAKSAQKWLVQALGQPLSRDAPAQAGGAPRALDAARRGVTLVRQALPQGSDAAASPGVAGDAAAAAAPARDAQDAAPLMDWPGISMALASDPENLRREIELVETVTAAGAARGALEGAQEGGDRDADGNRMELVD
jgi:hypothetical protein